MVSALTCLLLALNPAHGDQLLYFDNPSVVATLRPGGKIAGYYVGHSKEPFLSRPGELAICEFLFYGKWQATRELTGYRISAWETSLVPAPESKTMPGTIYVGYEDDDNDKWVIQMDAAPNGCRSRPDAEQFYWEDSSYFLERNMTVKYMNEQGLHVRVVRRARVVGVRVVHVDAAPVFSKSSPAKDLKPVFSVTLGDLVASIRQINGYSNIEYIVPATGKKLSGWVRTQYLKDPFIK
jgi:hypothetical protein